MSIRVYGKSVVSYSSWAAETEYSEDDKRVPTTSNGKCYNCTTAGTSGEIEPTWPIANDTTVSDGTVVWTCMDYEETPAALSVTLNKEGYGGYPLADVWMKSDGTVTFLVEVSDSGDDNTWRELASVDVNDREKFKQYVTPYRCVKVSTETVASNEIEIVAGE